MRAATSTTTIQHDVARCSQHGSTTTCDIWSREKLKTSTGYPGLKGKGSDVKLLVSWPAGVTRSAGDFDRAKLLASAAFSLAKS